MFIVQVFIFTVCNNTNPDIVFVLDESGSVGSTNFNKEKTVVKNIIQLFQIGPSDTQIGVVSYASSVNIDIHLNQYSDLSSLLNAIDNIMYSGGGTNTHSALTKVLTESFTSTNGDRTNSPNVVVVITDGRSGSMSSTLQEAEKLKKIATVMAVGIGSNINMDELKGISSSDMYLFHVANFDEFASVMGNISTVVCDVNGKIHL